MDITKPSDKTLDAANKYIYADLDEDISKKEKAQRLNHNQDLHDLRKEYLNKIYGLIITYLIVIGVLIVVQIVLKCLNKALNDSVLITILITTTANVLGIFYIVTKWLFPDPSREKK